MPKNIVFCADGTWNHPDNPVMLEDADTNVYKLFNCLEMSGDQCKFYDDGVGTAGLPLEKLLGGAFGAGLLQKVKDGYTAIAHVYDEGDDIFIFGFSRGAYTARSIAGMIATCGVPTENFNADMVNVAFNAYKHPDQRATLLASLADYHLYNAKIKMVGVWDTVGALGVPGAVFHLTDPIYKFLDTSLHPDVHAGYQALSIDEKRNEFEPTLWTADANAPADQIIDQVWFPGVHSDVGGGYAQCGLSDIALSWMLKNAQAQGLRVIENCDAVTKYTDVDGNNALDQIHESWNIFWGFPHHRPIAPGSNIANDVQIRLGSHLGYHASNLNVVNGQLTGYNVVQVVAPPDIAKAAGG